MLSKAWTDKLPNQLLTPVKILKILAIVAHWVAGLAVFESSLTTLKKAMLEIYKTKQLD